MNIKNVIFGPVRESALGFWLSATKREKFSYSDGLHMSFECNWQNNFTNAEEIAVNHCSIFCSMGEWNTLVTDILDDKRLDGLNIEHPANSDALFRFYTKLFLVFSEIMTDFQDVLNILRTGSFDFPKRIENEISRKMLSAYLGSEDELQNWFEFVNNICKHKTKNIHLCNHHIKYSFEDGDNVCDKDNFIHLYNVKNYILDYQSMKNIKRLDTVYVPSLQKILSIIILGYQKVDEEFRKDAERFGRFRELFSEVSKTPNFEQND